ncbi:protein of unknown function [Dethiosulfatibacter aminovorans DSM 17477]|uniref:Prolow-density lipoprotein receptor-related protein 1-like beta-propeller domain-containing protein n=1 Tax=Dethiosulfatibacter aminovorans DSM 17477 TaxID=1121476 RepID=A0A1M6JTN8_9FIRM|nr:DUF5050 domain-containing protein [Dethiosulfatibacter aminovorans]SHJ50041.1 protein of unknown function [Dethiosulfatibacter aminovorans DSM 17477]
MSGFLIKKKNGLMGRYLLVLLMVAVLLSGCGSEVPDEDGVVEGPGDSQSEEGDVIVVEELNGVGNTPGNINSGGLVAISDGWLYYPDPMEELLYKEKTDGSSKTVVIDHYARSINVIEDWIFYSNWSDNRCLYRVKTDGSQGTKIMYTNEEGKMRSIYCNYMTLVDNWIYLIDLKDVDDKIYRLRPDGSGWEPLIEDSADSFCIDGDWIFYLSASDDCIYRMRLDGTERMKFLDSSEDIDDGDYLATDGWLYFVHGSITDGFKFEKIETEGTIRATIENMNPDGRGYIHSFNVDGDWIYYYPDKLSKIGTDGSYQTFLHELDGDASLMHVAGDFIYFNVEGTVHRVKIDGSGYEPVFDLIK